MPSPPLQKFCFCANLKTGSIIIGALQIGYYIITLISVIIMLVVMDNLTDEIIKEAKNEGENHHEFEAVMKILAGILWPIIVFRLIGIPVSICLIIGALKSNKHLILPYLIFEGIAMAALFLLWLSSVPDNETDVDGFMFFIFLTLFLVLNKYFWLCVLSMYLLIANEQRDSIINGQAMIPLQAIPENQKMYGPANVQYQPQQQPLYIPQPANAYSQNVEQPPPYPVQQYQPPENV